MQHDPNNNIYPGFQIDPYGDCASPIFKSTTYQTNIYAPAETTLAFSSDKTHSTDNAMPKNSHPGELQSPCHPLPVPLPNLCQ